MFKKFDAFLNKTTMYKVVLYYLIILWIIALGFSFFGLLPYAPLTLIISGTDPLCNGDANGTVSVSVAGGTPPYTYLWTPSNATTSSVTGLSANTYVAEVWDNTGLNYCSGSISIVNPGSLIVNITPPAPVTSCSCPPEANVPR